MLNFADINNRLMGSFPSLVASWLPSGKREGNEWVALNPTRNDRTPGSFRINLHTGKWGDFATNDNGGDAISLYAYINHMDQGEAAKALAGQFGIKAEMRNRTEHRTEQRTRQESKPSSNAELILVPDNAPSIPNHYKHGKPSRVWDYRNQDGQLLGYILRFDTADGKEILPLTWDGQKWQWKSFPKPRPLYGLQKLSANPSGTVMLVEGEKAADAAQGLFPNLVVLTWAGGSKAVQHADFSPLQGRKVILCPDNDQPGVAAMLDVAEKLPAGCLAKWCNPPADAIPGWDFADANPDQDWTAYVRQNLTDVSKKSEKIDTLPEHVEKTAIRVHDNDNRAIDIHSLLPDANDKGRPLSTIENLEEICRRLGVVLRYNVITKEEEILIPNQSFSIDNQGNASLSWLASWCARFRMPTDKIGDYVTYLADQNQFNPVANWILAKPWDGTSRLADLFNTIKANNNHLKEVVMLRWLVSAVAAAFEPEGVSAHGVLVLQGDQYLGKTKWFKSLVPSHLGVVQDGMMLRPDDRDSVKQVCSFWLVELGELDATFRKSDIAALKSFITRKNDVIRRAYARKESQYARRTVFFGSVNPKQFLHDTTGNRRYWTIEATHIDHSHKIDMQQLWAEVYDLYKNGESWFLSPQEMQALNDHNEDFTVSDPIFERIDSHLDWHTDQSTWEWKSATDILVQLGIERPNQSDVTKAAQHIRLKNGGQGKRTMKGRLLLVPSKTW